MKLYPEIKCPYCRTQFGSYKIGDKVQHLDILWTSEAGLVKDCQDPEFVKANIESTDKYGNPKFNEDFQKKVTQLRDKFDTCPDDITKEDFEFDDYMTVFVECMNYGYIEGEDEKYDRDNITIPKLKQLWESGYSLNESLRSFIIKNNYDGTE